MNKRKRKGPDSQSRNLAPKASPRSKRRRPDARKQRRQRLAQRHTTFPTQGIEDLTVELRTAVAHHRSQARRIFWVMIGTAAVSIVVVIYESMHQSASVGGQSTSCGQLAAALLAGRLPVVAGAGGLVACLGRLHRRHTQQAVYYEDRLVGLHASGVIVSCASTEGREQVLQQMATTLLSLNANAFARSAKETGEGVDLSRRVPRRRLVYGSRQEIADGTSDTTTAALNLLSRALSPKSEPVNSSKPARS